MDGNARGRMLRKLLLLGTLLATVAGAGIAAGPVAAESGDTIAIRKGGKVRGTVTCTLVATVPGTTILGCAVRDTRNDRFRPFVVAAIKDGPTFTTVPVFAGRACTNITGAGTTRTCGQPIELPDAPTFTVRLRVGLVDRQTGAVVTTIMAADDWEAPVV